MSIKVTLGVCVKNAEKNIKEAIESIICQKYPSELIQVVIVDGCSKDKTIQMINDIIANTEMKIVICSDNGSGLGAARQIVVNKTNSKYIIFADADVRLFDDFVENHVKFMEENRKVGVAFGKPMHHNGTLVFLLGNLCQYITGGFSGNDATIYRTEALVNAGGFDPNVKGAGEDDDLINRIRELGFLATVNETSRFLHKNRETLRDALAEQLWFGYGNHYFSHKTTRHPTWRQNLIGAFRNGLRMAFKAYRMTHRKISFLLPIYSVLCKIFWWIGFFRAHIEGYGHKIR